MRPEELGAIGEVEVSCLPGSSIIGKRDRMAKAWGLNLNKRLAERHETSPLVPCLFTFPNLSQIEGGQGTFVID